MPTLAEILEAKRKARLAEEQEQGQEPVQVSSPAPSPVSLLPLSPTPAPVPAPVPVPSATATPVHLVASKPDDIVAPLSSNPLHVPPYALDMQNELKELAEQEDYSDVELSAGSLAEILNVILQLPNPPDVFVDECLEYASQALDRQKKVYIQRVMSGEKQEGVRNKRKQIAVALRLEADDLDNLTL